MTRTRSVLLFILAVLAFLLLVSLKSLDRQVALNTFLLGLGTCLLAIPLSLILARICATRGVVSSLLRLTTISLLFVPIFVQVSAWDSAVGKLGWLSWSTGSGFQLLAGQWPVAIWIHAIAIAPQLTVMFFLGLLASGRVYEEQASLDASENSVFWHITLPRMMPMIGIGIIWIFVTCAREIAVTDIYRIGTFAEQIYLGYSLGEFDASANVVTAIVMFVLAAGLVMVALIPYLDSAFSKESASKLHKSRPQASKVDNFVGLLLLLPLVVLPLSNLLLRASRSVEFTDSVAEARYSVDHLWAVVARVPTVFAAEISWSSCIALISSLISMLLATLLVWQARESKFWRVLLLLSVSICCGLPGPLIGSGLLWVRSIGESQIVLWLFDRTIFAPVIANIVFCWPVSCAMVWFVMRNTATDSLEHAKLEGVGSFSRLVRISIAGNLAGLCGVSLIVFAHSFGELSASQLVVPPGMDTVPRRMLGMLHSGVNDHTAGLTIVMVCFTMAFVAFGAMFVRWNRQRSLNRYD